MSARGPNYQPVCLRSHRDLSVKNVIQKSRIRVWTNLAAAKAEFEPPLTLDLILSHALHKPNSDSNSESLTGSIYAAFRYRRFGADAIYSAGPLLASVVHFRASGSDQHSFAKLALTHIALNR